MIDNNILFQTNLLSVIYGYVILELTSHTSYAYYIQVWESDTELMLYCDQIIETNKFLNMSSGANTIR
jgi:hypothetical protein